MPVLINKESNLAENLSAEQAQQAVQAGSHQVPLNDPEGNPIAVDFHDAADLISQGYSQPAPEQLGKILEYAKYSTLPEQIKTGAEAAGSSATFGLSTGLETALGVNPEDITKRREINPKSKIIGDVAGLVGSAVLAPEFGAAGLLEKGGAKAASVIGGEGLASILGRGALKGATENALFQVGDEVSKAFAENPEQSLQTSVIDVGLAGLLGGALGTAFSLPEAVFGKEAIKAGEESLVKDAEAIFSDTPEPTTPIAETQPLVTAEDKKIAALGGKEASDVAHFRQNSDRVMQNVENFSLDENAAAKASTKFESDYIKLKKETLPALEAQSEKVLEDSGVKINSQEIANVFEKRIASIKEDKGLMRSGAGQEMIDALKSKRDLLGSLDAEGNFQLHNEDWTGPEVRDYLRGLKETEKKLYTPGRPTTKVEYEIKGVLHDINEMLKDQVPGYREIMIPYAKAVKAEDQVSGLMGVNNWFKARVVKPVADKIDGVATPTAIGKEHKNYLAVLKNFEDVTGTKYSEIVQDNLTFGKLFPELAKGGQKGPLTNQIGRILGHVMEGTHGITDKLLSLATKAGGAIKEDAFKDLLTKEPSKFSQGVKDFYGATIGKVESVANSKNAFQAAADVLRRAYRSNNLINRTVKNIFQAGKIVLPSSLLPDRHTEKLSKQIENYEKNPEQLFALGNNLQQDAPGHAIAMTGTAARALEYLTSIKPKDQKLGMLDPVIKPSKFQQSAYERQLQIAQQPLSVLQHVKDGTLVPQDVITVKTIYPALYDHLSQKLMNEIIATSAKGEEIPYRTRVNVSQFLGQPLDASMTPQAIMSNQPQQALAQNQESGTMPKGSSLKALEKLPAQYQTPQQARVSQKLQ